jgi:uncharacterized membrane protein
MRSRYLIIASAGVALMLALVASVALSRLPAGTQLPVHWNAGGEPDRFADAAFALSLPVLLTAGLSGLFAILPRIEPLQVRMRESAPLLETCWAGVLAMMTVLQITVAAPAFDLTVSARLPLAAAGVLLIVIGNALPKSRPGFFVGIRTPWTLTDTDNWIATHRLGSRTMMAGGAAILLLTVLPIAADARATLVWIAVACSVLPPIIFSYWFWRKHGARA